MISKYLRIAAALLAATLPWTEMRGESVADSIPPARETDEYAFNARELILPATLLTIGIGGYYLDGFYGFNDDINKSVTTLRSGRYFHIDDYVQYLPAVTYLAFGSIGVKGKHSFRERLAVGLTAYLSMTLLTNAGKYSFHEKRPDSNARNSFPSGHTATAFTGAELMRIEYGIKYGIPAYLVATGVSFLRLYNGRHWLNDVIAGAGIGILSARIGYWMLPLYRKWFRWDRAGKDSMFAIAPQYEPCTRQFGVGMVYCW